MDGGAWWATVHGVTKSRTRLSDFTFTFHFHALEKEMATHSSVLACSFPICNICLVLSWDLCDDMSSLSYKMSQSQMEDLRLSCLHCHDSNLTDCFSQTMP